MTEIFLAQWAAFTANLDKLPHDVGDDARDTAWAAFEAGILYERERPGYVTWREFDHGDA